MNKRKWKVALLGAGYISEAHAKALQNSKLAELVAVCDLSRSRAERAARAYGIPAVFTDLAALLRSDIDAVHVLLPADAHFGAAQQVLEAGRHVLLEKPMAVSAAECEALVKLADQKGVKLGVSHNFLFSRAYECLRADVRSGRIGKLDQITVNWLFVLGLLKFGPFDNWMLRAPENLFLELGPHLVAFVLDLVGRPTAVHSDVFKPIDLPGGARAYRRWQAHSVIDDTGVALNFSVLPGFDDRSLVVRGLAASAKCDFARDLYILDAPSGAGVHFDDLLTTANLGLQYLRSAMSNFARGVFGKVRKGPSANPYLHSIARSVQSFYTGLTGTLDPRLDGRFGLEVMRLCEEIGKAVPKTAVATGRTWTVLPPTRQPSVLIIGGTGFIGAYLVRTLAEQGYGLRVVTRGRRAGEIALAGLPVELVQGDLADPVFMDSALAGIEVVYHLAKTDGKNWNDYYTQDVLVTRNIAERALAAGVRRFIYTGTIDSYYSADASSTITSDTPVDPQIDRRNLYARSKATCEALLMDLHKHSKLPLVIFRPGIVIGKGCPPAHWGVGMFESTTRMQFWGDGENKLPLVLVEDVAAALALALTATGIEGQCFLLTDAPLLSAREYVDVVAKELGTLIRADARPAWKNYLSDLVKEGAKNLIRHPNRRIPSYRDWDSRSHRARYDSSKTIEVLGWRPVHDRNQLVQRGIIDAVRDFMS